MCIDIIRNFGICYKVMDAQSFVTFGTVTPYTPASISIPNCHRDLFESPTSILTFATCHYCKLTWGCLGFIGYLIAIQMSEKPVLDDID